MSKCSNCNETVTWLPASNLWIGGAGAGVVCKNTQHLHQVSNKKK